MIIVVTLVIIAGPLSVALLVMWILPCLRRRRIPYLKSRRLSKPFYRWAFRQGKLFTAESIDYFINKYSHKYLRKRQKLGFDQLHDEELSVHSEPLEMSVHSLSGQEMEQLASIALVALHCDERVALALDKRMPHVSASLRGAFARFAEGLYAATCKNVGLSHAKVRNRVAACNAWCPPLRWKRNSYWSARLPP